MLDTGDRFPTPPFTALVWADQTLPIFDAGGAGGLPSGINAEELTVLTIDGDYFTCSRGKNPISIQQNAQLALLYDQDRFYPFQAARILSDEFPVSDTGVELRVCDAQGSVTLYPRGNLTALVGSGGGSAFTLSLTPERSGQWHYRFSSDQRTQPERDFFVRFSEVG